MTVRPDPLRQACYPGRRGPGWVAERPRGQATRQRLMVAQRIIASLVWGSRS